MRMIQPEYGAKNGQVLNLHWRFGAVFLIKGMAIGVRRMTAGEPEASQFIGGDGCAGRRCSSMQTGRLHNLSGEFNAAAMMKQPAGSIMVMPLHALSARRSACSSLTLMFVSIFFREF